MKLKKSELKRVFKKEIQKSLVQETKIEESTFVAAYNGTQGVFAHEFKAKDVKDALKKFIFMYKVPKSEWDKIRLTKSNRGLLSFFR
jgi:hypothetical protein